MNKFIGILKAKHDKPAREDNDKMQPKYQTESTVLSYSPESAKPRRANTALANNSQKVKTQRTQAENRELAKTSVSKDSLQRFKPNRLVCDA